jgi:prepilin signal peptidase PulO-like enzyme (type II secretory pathway)
MVVVLDAWLTGALASAALKLLITVVLAGVYGIVHRVSPQSLGWGDVLLVVPLTLAVTYVSAMSILWWQLAAATTSAVHAVIVRVRSGRDFVPFGPHLLLAAWAVLVVNV